MKLQYYSYESIPESWPEELLAGDSERTMVILFAGGDNGLQASDRFKQLQDAMPLSHIMGCSTSGEIHGTEIFDDSLVMASLKFESSDVKSAYAHLDQTCDSIEAGKHIAGMLNSDELKALIVLSDGLHVNGTDLVAGINQVVSKDVVVTGGLAGDGTRFEKTWVLGPEGPKEFQIAAIGLYGDHVRVGHGSKGGWSEFGIERHVTRSQKNVLYELDGEPALEIYKKYLGELAAELPASALWYPLAICSENDDDDEIVRTVLAVNEDEDSITFAGDVPEGRQVQLMRTNMDNLIDAAADVARMAGERGGNKKADGLLSLAISCVGRRLVLGDRTEDEVESVMENMPENTSQIGFYSFGEISPHSSGKCELHNQTMTLTTIWEE